MYSERLPCNFILAVKYVSTYTKNCNIKIPFPITSKPKQNTRIQHTKQTPSRSRITNPRFRFSPPQPSTTPAVTSTPCSRPASSGAAEATRTPSTSSCTGPAPSWAPWCPSASGTSPSSRTRWSAPSSPKKSRRGRDEIGTFEEKRIYLYIIVFLWIDYSKI